LLWARVDNVVHGLSLAIEILIDSIGRLAATARLQHGAQQHGAAAANASSVTFTAAVEG